MNLKYLFSEIYSAHINKQRILLICPQEVADQGFSFDYFTNTIIEKYNKDIKILDLSSIDHSNPVFPNTTIILKVSSQIFSTYYELLDYNPHIVLFMGQGSDKINTLLEKHYTHLIESLPKAGTLLYFEQDQNFLNMISKLGFLKDIYYLTYKLPKLIVKNEKVFIAKNYTPLLNYSSKKIEIHVGDFIEDQFLQHTIGMVLELGKILGIPKTDIYKTISTTS